MKAYESFLATKRIAVEPSGFAAHDLPACLFDFQRDIDRWSLERGRTAIFADCGLGKTPMQLVWAENVTRKFNKPVLILAPLAVSKQTEREGQKEIRGELNRLLILYAERCNCGARQPGVKDLHLDEHRPFCEFLIAVEKENERTVIQ